MDYNKKLAEYLINTEFASREEVAKALAIAGVEKCDLPEALQSLGMEPYSVYAVTGSHLKNHYEARAYKLGQLFVDLMVVTPEPNAIDAVPKEVLIRRNALPFKHDGTMLYVAMADIRDEAAIREIEAAAQCPIRAIAAVPYHIRYHIDIWL